MIAQVLSVAASDIFGEIIPADAEYSHGCFSKIILEYLQLQVS